MSLLAARDATLSSWRFEVPDTKGDVALQPNFGSSSTIRRTSDGSEYHKTTLGELKSSGVKVLLNKRGIRPTSMLSSAVFGVAFVRLGVNRVGSGSVSTAAVLSTMGVLFTACVLPTACDGEVAVEGELKPNSGVKRTVAVG